MSRARRLPALVAALVLFFAGAACRSAGPREIGGLEVEIRDARALSEGALFAAASRELQQLERVTPRTAAAASDAAFTMEHVLRDAGRAHARVRFELLPDEEAPQRLVFHVEEGPRTELGEVTFPGRRTVDEKDIRDMLTRRFDLMLRRDRTFRQSEIDEAVARIEQMYVLRGHHRAEVGPAEITWNADRTLAAVAIPIREGRRFTVSRTVVTGDLPEELRTSLRSLEGAPFHRRLAAEAAARIRGRLRKLGHIDADVRGRWALDDGEPTATITVDVDAGVQHVVRSVRLEGLDRSEAEFMRERIRLQPGEISTQSALDDAVDALFRTGAFASVDLRSDPVEGTDGERPRPHDLTFVLEEQPARSFEAGAGWGSYERLRGWVGYRDRNFMGIARSLDVVLHASTKSAGVTSRVTDRYILGPDRSLSLGARAETRQERSFDSDAVEGDVTARQRLDDRHGVFLGYRMKIESTDERDARVRREEEDHTRAAGLFGGIVHDSRDDHLFPTDGTLGELALFWSDARLGADLEFLETKLSLSRYFELGRGAVLAVGARLTTRDVLAGGETLPIQERLFLGGETTVRSFRQSELGPTDRNNDPLGGLTSAMAGIELRRSLWRDLDGAVFYEVGTVSPEAWDLGAPAGAAVGVGLRYRMPVGPVRLDFGYNPMHRFAADRRWAVHLSFGFSF